MSDDDPRARRHRQELLRRRMRCATSPCARPRPRARPRRPERRRQVDADEHHRRRARRPTPARCCSTARPTRRRPARRRAPRHRLHPPGAQPLHQSLDRREHLHRPAFPRRAAAADRPRGAARADRATCSAQVDLDLPPETPVERLSPGERQLVEVAKALQLDARIIIFDEPTTSLTARETERLFDLIERLRAGRQDDRSTSRTSSPTCMRSPTTSRCCATASWSRAGPQGGVRRRAA